MTERRMLIIPAEVVRRIDENRGDMSQAEFIDFLINSQFKPEEIIEEQPNYVTEEQLISMEKDIKKLLRSFLEFFVNYGMELGKQSTNGELEELIGKLQGLEKELDAGPAFASEKSNYKVEVTT